MKAEKAKAWPNIKEIGLDPSMIIYTDQDIVFGQDIQEVIDEVKALEPGHTLALFKDQGASKGELHSGIVFMLPGELAEKCLADWALKIPLTQSILPYKGFAEENSEDPIELNRGPDQRALGGTASCKKGKGIAHLNKRHLFMPTPAAMKKAA